MLNRVHRARRSDDPNHRDQPRRIFAALFKWEDCEELVDGFRELNIKGKSSIRINYMYGPKTTIRRNMALLKRKELKQAGIIQSAYISFPARLMGKKFGARKEDEYELIQDFSNEEVQLSKRFTSGVSG